MLPTIQHWGSFRFPKLWSLRLDSSLLGLSFSYSLWRQLTFLNVIYDGTDGSVSWIADCCHNLSSIQFRLHSAPSIQRQITFGRLQSLSIVIMERTPGSANWIHNILLSLNCPSLTSLTLKRLIDEQNSRPVDGHKSFDWYFKSFLSSSTITNLSIQGLEPFGW
ncbi:hypothetical protein BT96DRAFT_221641 [Gymnopus androsaceus JB14]|uniref:F-box domain-containing protein n=1 Tax=Gymnopus androsaceus JB14 TaxID=1447944 RepID=A0A6A4I7K5_9AGAR|nr:hypothetical protein BT96DRAFT_221641 [Gymnopus androsaceus JB14]